MNRAIVAGEERMVVDGTFCFSDNIIPLAQKYARNTFFEAFRYVFNYNLRLRRKRINKVLQLLLIIRAMFVDGIQ